MIAFLTRFVRIYGSDEAYLGACLLAFGLIGATIGISSSSVVA